MVAQEKEYEIHPLADLFPDMSREEMGLLQGSIEKRGLRDPISLYEGKIIDGKNRYKACLAVGVEPRFEPLSGVDSVVKWVEDKNLTRRHLKPSQRASIGAEIAKALAREIAAERRRARKDADGNGVSKIGKSEESRDAVGEAAKAANVSRSYVAEAKRIAQKSPEVAKEVREGKTTIPEAKRKLGLEKTNQPGKSKVNGEVVDDPPDVARLRKQGKIPQGVVPEVDGETGKINLKAVAENYEERAAIQDDLSAEDWLNGLPARQKLKGAQLRTFDANAIIYRMLQPATESFKEAFRRVNSRGTKKGHYIALVLSLFRADPPEKWSVCTDESHGGCSGTGKFMGEPCPMCHGNGFRVK